MSCQLLDAFSAATTQALGFWLGMPVADEDMAPLRAEDRMISVTRLKGQVVALNPDMIESVEENPDTTIRLTSGEKLLVRESLEQVVELVACYRRYLLSAFSVQPLSGGFTRHPSQIPGMSEK